MSSAVPLLWYFLLNLSLIFFIILDGADLGIGVLSLFTRNELDRSAMQVTIGPMWYANETWLVIAGAILFGAFPVAFGIALSSLYIPVMIVLFGLMFRAFSIEFRAYSAHRPFWEDLFGLGSLVAILGQGFVLGGLLTGLKLDQGAFVGSPWDWLNWFSVVIAIGLVFGTATLGASLLVGRTVGARQKRILRSLRVMGSVSLAFLLVTAVILPMKHEAVSRILNSPGQLAAVLVLLAGAVGSLVMLLRALGRRKDDRSPYVWSIRAFLLTGAALIASIFPYFIPFSVTIVEAAANRKTLTFMLFGVGMIIPIIVVYSQYARGVFSGKVHADIGSDEY